MDNNKVKTYLLDFQSKKLEDVQPREIKLPESKKIQTVIGSRRAGKTYLLYGKILELEEKGVPREQMIYLNFENPLFYDISYKEIREIIEIHWSIFPDVINKKIYLFIDEPQVVDKWEVAIRNIYDDFKVSIYLTGSSSRLLSREIATSLRGRSLTTILLPLSFKEYLEFQGQNPNISRAGTAQKASIINLLDEFIQYGSYPEIALEKDKEEKIKISKDYLDLTIYKDIIDRHKIKNTSLIKTLIDSVASSCSKEFSINKHYLDLKSRGLKLGKATLYEYFDALEDSFFVFPLKRFYYSKKSENLSIPKVYLGDVGFLNLLSMENFGQRFENAVFLELYRQTANNPLKKINYWKSNSGSETDFVVSQGKKAISATQVCYNLSNSTTKAREISGLLDCLKELRLESGEIINDKIEKEEIIDGKKIVFTPLWKWLLKEKKDEK